MVWNSFRTQESRGLGGVIRSGIERNEHIGKERLDERLAGLPCNHVGELPSPSIEGIPQVPQVSAAGFERPLGPLGLGLPRARNDAWDIPSRRGFKPRDYLSGGRVNGFNFRQERG